MLKIYQGRRDFLIALVGRMVSAFGDGAALVAITLRVQADGAPPYQWASCWPQASRRKFSSLAGSGGSSTRTTRSVSSSREA